MKPILSVGHFLVSILAIAVLLAILFVSPGTFAAGLGVEPAELERMLIEIQDLWRAEEPDRIAILEKAAQAERLRQELHQERREHCLSALKVRLQPPPIMAVGDRRIIAPAILAPPAGHPTAEHQRGQTGHR